MKLKHCGMKHFHLHCLSILSCRFLSTFAWTGVRSNGQNGNDRRAFLASNIACLTFIPASPASALLDSATTDTIPPGGKPFVYSESWTGTTLPLMNLSEAVNFAEQKGLLYWPMARWPDPILRRPAQPVDAHWFGTGTLQKACALLRATSVSEKAVGLAAQQCGVDARIVYLQPEERHPLINRRSFQRTAELSEITMINPQIVERSPELDVHSWREHCLVLPPTFDATVLRDSWVTIVFRDIHGRPHSVRLRGEMARAVQHELDHDRGILITDHVDMEELENDAMRAIESIGHRDRMTLAYARYLN